MFGPDFSFFSVKSGEISDTDFLESEISDFFPTCRSKFRFVTSKLLTLENFYRTKILVDSLNEFSMKRFLNASLPGVVVVVENIIFSLAIVVVVV